MRLTIEDDGTTSYTKIGNTKTNVVVQQDPHHKRLGYGDNGVWYVFRITPRKVMTEFEGTKLECIRYAEKLVSGIDTRSNRNRGTTS